MNNAKKSFALRISHDLFEEIRHLAESELRSVNSQIELLLRNSINHRDSKSKKPSTNTSTRAS